MLINREEIAILLSTYNGEAFLRKQLDSLLSQSLKAFHIYIRDDGSTDKTEHILKEYENQNPETITIIEDKTKHRGAANSFFFLLQQIDSAYYMFCDQDDLWLQNKVELSLKKIQEQEAKAPNRPIVAFTDLMVVDSSLKKISQSFNKVNHLDRFLANKEFLMVHNVVTGCAMIFNKLAKKISLPVSPYAYMHDEWISLCTYFKNGVILPINEAAICYRQHAENTVGAKQYSLFQKLKSSSRYKQLFKKANLMHSAFGISYFKFIKLKIQYGRAKA